MTFQTIVIQRRPAEDFVSGSAYNRKVSSYNLGKIQAIIANSVEHQILEFVHYPKQVLSEGGHFVELQSVEQGPSRSRMLLFDAGTLGLGFP